MSELSFLIELLLNHDLPKATKDLIASRIKEVEQGLTSHQVRAGGFPIYNPSVGPTAQAPSTLAAMARHGDIPAISPPVIPPVPVVERVAQTPATAAALTARNEAITRAASSRPLAATEKGRTSPRKW